MVDVVCTDSQPHTCPWGPLFLGRSYGQPPGSSWEPSDLKAFRVDAVIPGSVEEVDTMGLGSPHCTQGTKHREAGFANVCNVA